MSGLPVFACWFAGCGLAPLTRKELFFKKAWRIFCCKASLLCRPFRVPATAAPNQRLFCHGVMKKNSRITSEYLSYKGVISAILTKLGYVSAPEIEDILQETYLQTYQSAIAREIQFPKAYMVKTALRIAKSSLDKRQRYSESEWSDEALSIEHIVEGYQVNQPEPDELCIHMEEFALLCEAVNTLPQQCRKVFVMKKIFGLSQREIAAALSLSQSTVEKHVAKGMLCCARHMKAATLNTENKAQANPATPLRRHTK